MGLNRIHVAALTGATVIALAAACTGGSGSPQDNETAFPYPESMFDWRSDETTPRCEMLAEQVPDNGFIDKSGDYEVSGDDLYCHLDQEDGATRHTVAIDITTQWWKGDKSPEEILDFALSGVESVPIAGLGERAVLVSTAALHPADPLRWDDAVSLLVIEGNLLLNFWAGSRMNLEGPNLRDADLVLASDTVIGTAEAYLEDLGAENHTLQPEQAQPAGGITELPDLCAALDLDGMSLAGDQSDWADTGPLIDRCHWEDDNAALWLSAEAVGPLDAAGLSAEEFASWWTQSVPTAAGEASGLGDESYLLAVDANPLGTEEQPATDFVVRIGNVVLQGRYQDGTADSGAAAEGFASTITDQAQSLLAGG
jgi:hypothetical protein